MQINYTEIIITLLTAVIIPVCANIWKKYVAPWIADKNLEKWVDIAAKAAEQLYKTKEVQDRKAYALNILAGKGINIDDAAVIAAVEAKVHEINIENQSVAK